MRVAELQAALAALSDYGWARDQPEHSDRKPSLCYSLSPRVEAPSTGTTPRGAYDRCRVGRTAVIEKAAENLAAISRREERCGFEGGPHTVHTPTPCHTFSRYTCMLILCCTP